MFLSMPSKTSVAGLVVALFLVFANSTSAIEVLMDCYPDQVRTCKTNLKECCEARKCNWADPSWGPTYGNPACTVPENWGYKIDGPALVDVTRGEINLSPTTAHTQRYTTPLPIRLAVEQEGVNRLRLRFFDPKDATRFEIPESIMALNPAVEQEGDANYKVSVEGDEDSPFGLQVWSTAGDLPTKIIDTTGLPGFTFEDQFIEINMRLPTENIFGFGEHEHLSFKHNWNRITLPMFARSHTVFGIDKTVDDTYPNLYGTHPFFMGMDSRDQAYGVLFWNSNAQEVVLQPLNIMTFRTIGGILDMRIMFGPTPKDVIRQYHEMIGKPYFPPYWALGFQLCQYWYGKLDVVKEVHANMTSYQIPFDVQQFDIDYMDRQRDFTTDPEAYVGIRAFVDKLHEDGMRSVMILDPAISNNDTIWSGSPAGETYPAWIEGVAADNRDSVFLRFGPDEGGEIIFGKVWPDFPSSTKEVCHTPNSLTWDEQVVQCRAYSAFPDWGKQSAQDWWVKMVTKFHTPDSKDPADAPYGEGLPFDGIWIDMNEPESFIHGSLNFEGKGTPDLGDGALNCPKTKWDNPPYTPHVRDRDVGLQYKSLCLSPLVTIPGGEKTPLYNMHSLYGHSMAKPTLRAANAATKKRSMVFSRSSSPGTGALIGHWLGDNMSKWDSMRRSVIGIIEMNIFGITYTGSDICGFSSDSPGGMDRVEEELCYRWTQLGAFYTFSRNHNLKHKPSQDPGSFGDDFAAMAKTVLETRYKLLPYLYTTMWEAHQNGGTVLRSMLEEFPTERDMWTVDTEFFWGSGLRIIPVLTKGADSVDVRLGGTAEDRWYDYYTSKQVKGKFVNFPSPRAGYAGKIPLLVRGGHILPGQEPAATTTAARLNPMTLIIALDSDGQAKGTLHWDEGEDDITAAVYKSLHLSMVATVDMNKNGKLTISSNATNGYSPDLKWGKVEIWGMGDDSIVRMELTRGATVSEMIFQEGTEGNCIVDLTVKKVPINEGMSIEWKVDSASATNSSTTNSSMTNSTNSSTTNSSTTTSGATALNSSPTVLISVLALLLAAAHK